MKTLVAASEPDPFQWASIVESVGMTASAGPTVIVASFEDHPTTATTTAAWTTTTEDLGA